MRASRAVDLDADIVPGPVPQAPPPAAFLRSLGPVLDSAFGIEHGSLLPDALAALAARLRAGPLGQPRADASEIAVVTA